MARVESAGRERCAAPHRVGPIGRVAAVVLLGLASACGAPASTVTEGAAVDGAAATPLPEAILPATHVRVVESVHVPDQSFRVSVALPYGYDPSSEARYPVLYVLDADLAFGTAVEVTRALTLGQELPPLVVVGVGYPVGSFVETLGVRARDLTPTNDPVWLEESLAQGDLDGMPPPVGAGGGPAFLRFLTEELIPLIDAEYRSVPGDRGLFGDSLGGLFALYALLHQPDAFPRTIIGSPSLWWDDEVSFGFLEDYLERSDDLRAAVYLGVGGLEEEGAQAAPFRMVSNVERLSELLARASLPSLRLETHVFDGETHLSVPPMIFSRGVRSVYPVARAGG